jgi:flagellar biosynthesis chaperone FliJ
MREDMRELGRLYQVAKKEKEQLENQNSSLLRTVDDLKHKISNLQRKPSPEIQITSARYHSPTHAYLGSGRKEPTPYQERQT